MNRLNLALSAAERWSPCR